VVGAAACAARMGSALSDRPRRRWR